MPGDLPGTEPQHLVVTNRPTNLTPGEIANEVESNTERFLPVSFGTTEFFAICDCPARKRERCSQTAAISPHPDAVLLLAQPRIFPLAFPPEGD